MIRSMTGFGVAERAWEHWAIKAEARSVNHSELRLSIRLPDMLRLKESELAGLVRARARRGHVYLILNCSAAEQAIALLVDRQKIRTYLRLLKEIADAEGVPVHADAGVLMSLPGAMRQESLPQDVLEGLLVQAAATAEEALDAMLRMREAEGRNLVGQLEALCSSIEQRTNLVEANAGMAVREYQRRLTQRVRELLEGSGATADQDAIARQVAILAERSDVSEEITRLRSHLEQFRKALQHEGEPVGRKLEFLAQEMLRESSTMAAKIQNTELAEQVIEIKADVARLREQVRNVE